MAALLTAVASTRKLLQHDLKVKLALAAQHGKVDRGTRRGVGYVIAQRIAIEHGRTVEGDNHVTGLKSGMLCGAAGDYGLDDESSRSIYTQPCCGFGRNRPGGDPELAAPDFANSDELVKNTSRHV